MAQLTIDYTPPHNGTPTSRAAAESIRAIGPKLQRRILALLATAPEGLTCDDIEVALEMSHQTASARLRELVESKKLYFHGARDTRSGRKARVYFLKAGK